MAMDLIFIMNKRIFAGKKGGRIGGIYSKSSVTLDLEAKTTLIQREAARGCILQMRERRHASLVVEMGLWGNDDFRVGVSQLKAKTKT